MSIKLLVAAGAMLLFFCTCTKDKTTVTRTPPRTYAVKVTSNIKYGSAKNWMGVNEDLSLDLYTPKKASASVNFPLVVLVHGGTFLVGNKDNLEDLAKELSNQGFIVASINYRLGWNSGVGDCDGDSTSSNEALYRGMQDLNASLRFLTANADKYFIDTKWIFTGGASAGAIASLNAAYLTDDAMQQRNATLVQKLGGLNNADNDITATYTVKAVCSMWGGVIDENLIISTNAVPCIAFHGSADQTVPVNTGTYAGCNNYQKLYGSEFIYNKLKALGVPVVAHIYPGEGHGPAEYTPQFIADNTACFFNSLMSKDAETGYYEKMESNCE